MNQIPNAAARKTPGLVNWVGYLAITLLLALPIAVLAVRSGEWQQGLLLYAIGCFGAAILLLLAAMAAAGAFGVERVDRAAPEGAD